jgi:hypothetical protein
LLAHAESLPEFARSLATAHESFLTELQAAAAMLNATLKKLVIQKRGFFSRS